MGLTERIFPVSDFIQPSDGEPIRSVVLETAEAVIVVWHVKPGQSIPAHIHPHGQDTWTVLAGEAEYFKGNGETQRVKKHEVVVAGVGQVHGAKTVGNEDFVFVSVVAPGNAGYALADNT